MDRANLEATGIGAAACSRHGFFAPHACVDFQQGERYVGVSTVTAPTNGDPCYTANETWITFYTGFLRTSVA